MSSRYAHALWCDDIRHEVGNKPSFMGCYTGGLSVQELPLVMPQLSMQVWAVTPKDDPFKRVVVRVKRSDGHQFVEVEPDLTTGTERTMPPDASLQTLMFGFTMGPLELLEDSKWLSVEVETERETLLAPKLRVTLAAQPIDQAPVNPAIGHIVP